MLTNCPCNYSQRSKENVGNSSAFRTQAFDFVPSARFSVSIYPNWATAQDQSASPRAVGELILGPSVYTDDSRHEGGINEDPAAPKKPVDRGEPDYGVNEKLNGHSSPNNARTEPIPLVLSRGVSTEHKALKQHSVAEGWRKAWRDRIKKTAQESLRWVKDDGVPTDTIPRVHKLADEGSSWVRVDEIHDSPHRKPKKWGWW